MGILAVGGLLAIKQRHLKSNRINDMLIYELPDRIGFSLRFFSLMKGTKGVTKMKRLLTAGIFGTILGIVGAGTANASIVSSGFLDEKLTEYALSTSLDLKANQTDLTALSNKIGTLPSAILPSMWTDVPYYTENGVNMPDAGFPLPTTIGEQLEFLFLGDSPIDRMFRVITLAGNGVPVGTLDPGSNDPQAEFLGLNPLTQKVRSIEKNITLPDGLTVANLYNGWTISNGEYINGLSIIAQDGFTTYDPLADELRSGRKTESGGYLNVLARLLFDDGYYQAENSVLAPFWYLTKQSMRVGEIPHGKTAAGMIDEINTKIGTLPSGNLLGFPESESLFSWSNQPYTYPTSLAELINAIYGNSETGQIGFLAGIVTGFPLNIDGDDIIEGYVGTLPNFELAKNANDLANANATKIGTVPDGKNLAGMIGTLPDGYDSVGAALTAIKGIAEDAKAAALAAIPDPKQEGSSGKFVLTVDIVGDNATYHWEKIDREGETTTE